MLPLSLIRQVSMPSHRPTATPSRRGWLRPANTAAQSVDETRSAIVWAAIATALGILIALGHVWLRIQVFEVGYRLSTTRQVIQRLEREGQDLMLAAATLDTPSRTDALARKRLGMVPPDKGQELVIP